MTLFKLHTKLNYFDVLQKDTHIMYIMYFVNYL